MGHGSRGSGPQRSRPYRGTVPIREVWGGFLEEAGCVLKEKRALRGQEGGVVELREKALHLSVAERESPAPG